MSHAKWLAFAALPPLPHVKIVRSFFHASNSVSMTAVKSERLVPRAISADSRR
jgi:hypothetical protein